MLIHVSNDRAFLNQAHIEAAPRVASLSSFKQLEVHRPKMPESIQSPSSLLYDLYLFL
jgi:hypothetical protein